MYNVSCSENFTITSTPEIRGDITVLHLHAACVSAPGKLTVQVRWAIPASDTHLLWGPINYVSKNLPPIWGSNGAKSYAMSSAPVFSCIGFNDTNRLTIACSDAKNCVRICGVVEEPTALLRFGVTIDIECTISEYDVDVLFDSRSIPFYEAVEDVVKWWETFDGYTPALVPDSARDPLYSAWYSYHQDISPDAILEECRYFSKLGCKVIILDDGWHTAIPNAGYGSCGDWEVSPEKIPDMKAFVDAVHETGMKFMLWYSVPFIGELSKAYDRFKDKMLYDTGMNGAWVVDPRYPEVREYLIDIYRRAMIDWGLDGFKLDFIDSFRQSDVVKEGMDYVSVYDAVDRLMKDVIAVLRGINPDVLIEFRQSYIGPLMRTFGNMFRSGDCPRDSFRNRLNVLSLRQISGNSAVHSDMTMWHSDAPAEEAAFQLTNVLFSVPQISVRCRDIPEEHAEMIKTYLEFWTKYRNVLLDGKMLYKNYAANYTYVSSLLDNIQVGAVYSGLIAYLEKQTDEIALVNASGDREVLVCADFAETYRCVVTDCTGTETFSGEIELGTPVRIPMPVNGYAYLTKIA